MIDGEITACAQALASVPTSCWMLIQPAGPTQKRTQAFGSFLKSGKAFGELIITDVKENIILLALENRQADHLQRRDPVIINSGQVRTTLIASSRNIAKCLMCRLSPIGQARECSVSSQ